MRILLHWSFMKVMNLSEEASIDRSSFQTLGTLIYQFPVYCLYCEGRIGSGFGTQPGQNF